MKLKYHLFNKFNGRTEYCASLFQVKSFLYGKVLKHWICVEYDEESSHKEFVDINDLMIGDLYNE